MPKRKAPNTGDMKAEDHAVTRKIGNAPERPAEPTDAVNYPPGTRPLQSGNLRIDN